MPAYNDESTPLYTKQVNELQPTGSLGIASGIVLAAFILAKVFVWAPVAGWSWPWVFSPYFVYVSWRLLWMSIGAAFAGFRRSLAKL